MPVVACARQQPVTARQQRAPGIMNHRTFIMLQRLRHEPEPAACACAARLPTKLLLGARELAPTNVNSSEHFDNGSDVRGEQCIIVAGALNKATLVRRDS